MSKTHVCYFHNLTACVGELQDRDIEDRIGVTMVA
ncbi:hypothetical protein [Flaviflexus massiliensis]